MPTPHASLRIPQDLRDAALARGREDRLSSLTDVTIAALQRYAGSDGCPACRQSAIREQALQAELDNTRAELARLRRHLAKAAGQAAPQPPAGGGAEAAFAARLQEATEENPVPTAELAAVSGRTGEWVRVHVNALIITGYARRPRKGEQYAVPGMSIAEGLREVAGRVHQIGREAPDGRKAGTEARPQPEPATARTGPPEARSAAVARVRERAATAGVPIITASELPAAQIQAPPPGTAKFQAPGAAPVVMQAVPEEIPDPGRKKARTAQARCVHRIPAGSWCKQCGRTI